MEIEIIIYYGVYGLDNLKCKVWEICGIFEYLFVRCSRNKFDIFFVWVDNICVVFGDVMFFDLDEYWFIEFKVENFINIIRMEMDNVKNVCGM